MKKVVVLYVDSDKEAGVDCSLLEMLDEMEVLDYEVRPMTKAEAKVFD
jgi:hypothetical protein